MRIGSRWIFSFALACLICALLVISAHALTGQVVLSGGLDGSTREQIESVLTAAVNAIDQQNLEPLRDLCTDNGWRELTELTSSLKLRNARPLHEARLLQLSDGYEVRNIKVQVDRTSMQDTEADPYQYMVFTLTPSRSIHGVRLAVEPDTYEELFSEADSLNDFAFRQQILQFVEIYRTAYNRKDLEYIEKVFSEDALIIVGRMVKPDPNSPTQSDRFRSSPSKELRDNVEFFRQTKNEYIRGLRWVFDRNAFISVSFDSVVVVRHDKDPYLYGVTLKQEWRSSTYGDTGYVFLMIDFADEENPLIHVRSWQPEKFPDNTTIDLYDFQLVRTERD